MPILIQTFPIVHGTPIFHMNDVSGVSTSPVFRRLTAIIVTDIYLPTFYLQSRDSSVGIALDDRGSGVRFPTGAGNFSLHHRVQNGSGANSASYPKGTRGSFPGGKSAGA
jgi:hypothetical protein